MKAFARDMFDLARTYVVGAVVAFGWLLLGIYMYTRPVPINSLFGADFNHDLGTSLVAQGLIFFPAFIIGGAIRIGRGRREQDEAAKDRQMLRELYEWMQEQRKTEAVSIPSGLPVSSGNGAKPEVETSGIAN